MIKTPLLLALWMLAAPAGATVLQLDLAGPLGGPLPGTVEDSGLIVTFDQDGTGYTATFSEAVAKVTVSYGSDPGTVPGDGVMMTNLMAFGFLEPGGPLGLLATDFSTAARDTLTAAVTGTAGITKIAFSSSLGRETGWDALGLSRVPTPLTPALLALGLGVLGLTRRYGFG